MFSCFVFKVLNYKHLNIYVVLLLSCFMLLLVLVSMWRCVFSFLCIAMGLNISHVFLTPCFCLSLSPSLFLPLSVSLTLRVSLSLCLSLSVCFSPTLSLCFPLFLSHSFSVFPSVSVTLCVLSFCFSLSPLYFKSSARLMKNHIPLYCELHTSPYSIYDSKLQE